MATANPKTTTTPRARAGRATSAKAAPKAPAATTPAAEPETTDTKTERFVLDLEYVTDTKRYAKFEVPKSLDGTVAGSIYVPLGTDKVKVAIMGVEADSDEE